MEGESCVMDMWVTHGKMRAMYHTTKREISSSRGETVGRKEREKEREERKGKEGNLFEWREKKERKERKKEKRGNEGNEGDRRFLSSIYDVPTIRIRRTKE